MEKKKSQLVVPILIIAIALIIFIPLFFHKGAEFPGSDEAGSGMVDEVTGGEYKPWFAPIMERAIGGEIPGEMETLFFCIQTGIGTGIIAFCFGWLAAKRKYSGDPAGRDEVPEEKVS